MFVIFDLSVSFFFFRNKKNRDEWKDDEDEERKIVSIEWTGFYDTL